MMPNRERASIINDLQPPFAIHVPEVQRAPIVLCSPHSGRTYTLHFLAQTRLDPLTLRKSEDCYVEELFAGAVEAGIPLIAARFPRAYLDVNREPFELDPELFSEVLPDYANTRSVRVVGGLGTIARIVADGEEIYASPIPLAAALERISLLYEPFHNSLAELLNETRQRFGYAILIDCHSMPSALMAQTSGPRPDCVLGDRYGVSCDPRITRFLREALAGRGYEVQLNRPYAGGFITEHYGRPAKGLHAIQIEINRGLYVDEMTLARAAGFETLKRDLDAVCARAAIELPLLLERRAAAE